VNSPAGGALLVLSGPSGVGKTTIARKLAQVPGLTRVMTTTTRRPRPQEVDGRDYRFASRAEFEAMIARGEFLEHAEIDGNLYGTPREAIERALAAGKTVLVDIDPQGARSVRALGLPAVFIFVEPPSFEELRKRLEGRRSEDPEAVRRRLERAGREMAQKDMYDATVVNRTVEGTVEEILAEVRRRKLLR
jgi:guanylate kinase